MPSSRRLLIAAALAAPVVGFGIGSVVVSGSGSDGRPAAVAKATTTTTVAATTSSTTAVETTTTTAAPTTTTARTAALAAGNGPQAPADAAGVARMIEQHDAALMSASTPARDVAASAHLLQVAYRALVSRPEQRATVFGMISAPDVRQRAMANVEAGAKLRSMITKPKDTLPDWKIVPPAPAEELVGYYRAAGEEFGLPWQYLASIHLVETRMGRIRGTSSAGAQGPMQFMPATWKAYGEGDINSNADAIRAAARYLQRNGAPGNMRQALWNYNHDYRYVDAVTAYAEVMRAAEPMYRSYHGWQVYYLTSSGDVWLPEGWSSSGT